jgi:hypothetical protein
MISDQEPTSSQAVSSARESRPTETRSPSSDEALSVLRRIERVLGEVRGALDVAERERQHKEFSSPRLIGAILQVIVGGLVALAVLDWVFGARAEALLVKLAFAAVLQLIALTALLFWRRNGSR